MAKKLAVAMLAPMMLACLAWTAPKSWTGTVSDDMCGMTKHDMACVEKCVAGGHARYILVSKDKIYTLQPQDKFKGLGGRQVKVTGMLSGDAITVESVKVKCEGQWRVASGLKLKKPCDRGAPFWPAFFSP